MNFFLECLKINRIWRFLPSVASCTRPMALSLRSYLYLILGAGLLLGSAVGYAEEAPVKVLTVGNSFADNATTFLPQLAQAGGHKLLLFRAIINGASLAKHVACIKAFEANPSDPLGSPYYHNMVPQRPHDAKMLSLQAALQLEKWDLVTIQQASAESYKPETYEPYAGTLIDYIKKYAPQAKILIHQTWAYREDCNGYINGFTQEKMYEGLTSAYRHLAEKYSLKIIPVGLAFQAARKTDLWHFQFPEPNFDYKNPVEGTLPVQKGSLNAGWNWSTNAQTGKKTISLDFKHANLAGKYLGGAVWYEVIFGPGVEPTPFVPQGLDPGAAAQLRTIARTSVAQFEQVVEKRRNR